MAQPKGYAAFILFPHLKMIPLRQMEVGYDQSRATEARSERR